MNYILNLKLETEKYQEDILAKRFEISRKIYNDILGKALKKYKELIKTNAWRKNQNIISGLYKIEKEPKKLKKTLKECIELRKELLKNYNLSEYSLHAVVKPIQHYYKRNIDSHVAQQIATRVWRSIEKVLHGNGKKVYFKKFEDGLDSIEGKSNCSGIRYKIDEHVLVWNKLEIKVQSNLNDYEKECLKSKIKYCRLKRTFIKGKYKYTLQLVLEGSVPTKRKCADNGTVGIDIGTQTIAYTSDQEIKLLELAPTVQNIENKKRILLRYLDRSKRANNPNNFNEDGTIKKRIKLTWVRSNRYKKAKYKLKDLYRKQAEIRKQDHEKLANKILSQGNIVKVEKMNFKGLQRRAKETKISEKTGKITRKKRFGKSLANKAPGTFLRILENKLMAVGGQYIEVNTYKVKASQYNHLNEEYNKKKLSQRWNYFEGTKIKIQRDIYSSYLIKHVNDDLETINNELCNKDFKNFVRLHDIEISRLSNHKNISSMGV
ncbi:transposase (plasmid) [Mycoplasmatota bacterium]|nr:transposase [Mycoplasmatota bacterium]